jgi:hypothetical protein
LVTKDRGAILPDALNPLHKPWYEVPAADIPGKEVLVTAAHLGRDASGNTAAQHTPELPRVGLTTYTIDDVSYCLEPAGITNTHGKQCQNLPPTVLVQPTKLTDLPVMWGVVVVQYYCLGPADACTLKFHCAVQQHACIHYDWTYNTVLPLLHPADVRHRHRHRQSLPGLLV